MENKKKMKILIFGNPLVEKDNLALKLMPKLKTRFPEIQFIEADPTEELQKYGKNLTIIDVVEESDKVRLIEFNSLEDFNKLETNKIYSMHDFDLAYNLKLLKKINKIETVKIIGIPIGMDEEEGFEGVCCILEKIK